MEDAGVCQLCKKPIFVVIITCPKSPYSHTLHFSNPIAYHRLFIQVNYHFIYTAPSAESAESAVMKVGMRFNVYTRFGGCPIIDSTRDRQPILKNPLKRPLLLN